MALPSNFIFGLRYIFGISLVAFECQRRGSKVKVTAAKKRYHVTQKLLVVNCWDLTGICYHNVRSVLELLRAYT